MHPISNAFRAAMNAPAQIHRLTGTVGNVAFDESNIVNGSFVITNQSTCTDDVVLGSCYVGELQVEFTGLNITWSNWIKKTITPSFGLKIGDNEWETVPLGVFRIAKATHTAYGVKIVAYDNMTKFDKKFKKSHFMNLAGMYNIINQLCTDSGVTLGMTQAQIEALPNGDRTGINVYGSTGKKSEFANDITTNRDLLFWVAQTLGCFATIDRAGQLVFRQYTQNVVDVITNEHRLAGATFEDYITHYIGIYMENLDDNTEDYYGYDSAALTQELNETSAEISADNDEIDDLNADKAEWDEKLAHGQCTQAEYDEAVAEINAQIKAKQKDIKQLTKRLSWLEKALQSGGDDGSDMVLGANPLTMAKNKTTRDQQRREILGALADISYTPFSANVVCGCIYDLGDVIQFSGGLYNSSTDSFGCVMSYTYTHNGGTELEGYGADPSVVIVRNKTQKSVDRAQKNATTALNENDMVFDFGDGNEVIATNKKAYESAGSMTRKMQFWEHNFNFPAGQDWAKYNTSVTAPYPFVICTYPDLDHGNPRYYNLNGKVMQSFVVVLVFKLSDEEIQKVGNQFMLTNQSWQAYEGNLNHGYNNFGSYVYRDTIYYSKYYYCGTGTGTLMYGLIGEVEPDYKFNSWNDMMYAMNNGTINIPGVTPDDECVLPTESTAVQAAANAEYFAEKLAGNNPTRTSEPYIGNVNLMSEKTMQRLSDAFYQMGEAADNIGAVSDVKVDNVSVVTDKVANINSMTGATAQAAGTKGLVPAPASGDNEKFLRGDGTWQTVQGGGSAEMLSPTPFIYSDSEEQVGIWRDGKPIYQKSFTFSQTTVLDSNTWYNTPFSVPNGISIKFEGTTNYNGGSYSISGNIKSDGNVQIIQFRNTSINLDTITVWYTKTTDTAWQGGFKAYGFSPVIYSDTEREIGVWIDGKPLYQKTIPFAFSGNVQVWTLFDDSVSYEYLISSKAIFGIYPHTSNDHIDHYNARDASPRFAVKSDHKLYYYVNGLDSRDFRIILTIQYTKTTDAPGSGHYAALGVPAVHYDDTERVIGTWFGETLYQKTFRPTSPTAANTAQVIQDITSLNVKDVINLFGNISNVPINWSLDSSNGVSCFVTSAKTGIAMKVINSLLTNITCNITLQYTKTS